MTLARQLLELGGAAMIVVGPLPLCLALVSADAMAPDTALERLLGVLTLWCLVEATVGVLLCAIGGYALGPVLFAEAGLLAVGLLVRGTPGEHTPAARTPAEILACAALAVVGAGLLLRLAVTPITDYDSLAYHLPAMASWYQAHTFVRLEQFSQISRYPYVWEILSGLLMLPFREDFLVELPGLVAWLMLALATYVAALELGARRAPALAAAFLVVATPIARHVVLTMHVDLPLAACFLAGFAFTLAHARAPSWRTLGLVTAASGLVAGIKMSGLVYDALLAVAYIVATVAARRSGRRFASHGVATFGVAVAGALVVGGVWYALNWLELGNPLGYLRVEVAGVTLFPGRLAPENVRRTTLAALFQATSRADWSILLRAAAAEGGLPVLVLALGVAGLRLRRPHLAVATLLVVTGFVYWTTPYGADNDPRHTVLTPWMAQGVRYALPFVGVLGIAAALGAGALGSRVSWASAAAVILALPGAVHPLTPLAVALLTVFGAGVVLARRGGFRGAIAAAALVALVVNGTAALRARRHVERAARYGGVPEFVSATVGRDEAVGYLLSNRSYLFYGVDYTTRVVYMPAGPGGREAWLDALRGARVVLVAVGPLSAEWRTRREVAWLEDPGGPFTRVFGHDETREPLLFRLQPPS